mgnify:CR=1 FL=1|jgi:alpha-L-arabinofuranosidase
MPQEDQLNAILSILSSRPAAGKASELGAADGHVIVNVDLGAQPVVSRHIFGLFLEHLGRCIYDGVWEDSRGGASDSATGSLRTGRLRAEVVKALQELCTPNLRWPGGCFADGYHWRDGVGPPSERPRTVNQHWGGGIESNAFGSHEFLDLCAAVGCEPFVVGNVVLACGLNRARSLPPSAHAI